MNESFLTEQDKFENYFNKLQKPHLSENLYIKTKRRSFANFILGNIMVSYCRIKKKQYFCIALEIKHKYTTWFGSSAG
jgi:hypothetical protein